MKQNKALQVFFWGCFAVFLLASIRHVAWFFYSQEQVSGNWYDWIVPYALAFAVDITSFVVSLTITKSNQSGKGIKDTWMGWLLVWSLAIFSWYVNYRYSSKFIDTTALSPSTVTIPFTDVAIDINPLIASGFQVMAIAYAWVSDKLLAEKTNLVAAYSDEDFQQKLKRIEQEKQLKAAQKGAGFWEKAKEAKQGFSDLIAKENDVELIDELEEETDAETEEESEPDLPEKKERNTGPLTQESEEESEEKEEGNVGGNDEETNQETSKDLAIDPDALPVIARYPKVAQMLSTKGTTVSVEEVAIAFEITPTLVRNRVKTGKIRKTKNPEKVYKESVISWAKLELLPKGKGKVINLESARKSQEKADEKQQINANG